MRKGYLLIALCLLSTNKVLKAQTKPISYEFQTGINISTMKDKLNKSDWGVGMYSKGLVDFKVAPHFNIATGLGYRFEQFNSKRGFTYQTNDGYDFQEVGVTHLKRHWLDVPILFKGNIYLNESNKFELYVGPQISMLLGGSGRDVTTGEVYKMKPDVFKDRLDYSLNFGASYVYDEKWSFSVNYGLGLKNDAPTKDLGETTRNISIGAGYKF